MTVLVTGVSGFSGSHIAAALARIGHEVMGLYRRGPGFAEGLAGTPGITLRQADLASALALPGPFETIVHTAATSPAPGISDADIIRDNAEATQQLADAAERLGCARFIYLSSLSIYGEISVPVVDESTPIISPDVYGETKFSGEQALSRRADAVPAVALRLPGVIGKGAHRNWLSGVAARLRKGETVRAFNLTCPYNNACHVEDLAALVVTLCGRTWRGFDAMVLGARGMTTIAGAIETLAGALGVEARVEEIPAPKAGFTLSSDHAIAQWGYAPMDIGAMIARYGSES